MNKTHKIFWILLLLLIASFIFNMHNKLRVCPGQLWKRVVLVDNPFFENYTIRTYEVLEIRKGWVRYKECSSKGMYRIEYSTISDFLKNYKIRGRTNTKMILIKE